MTLWTSIYSLTEGTLYDMKDGYHLSHLAVTKSTQMILNLVCNDNMNFNDGSCCKSSDKPSSLQIIAFSVLGVGLLLSFVVICYEMICKRHPSHQYPNYRYRLLPRPGNTKHYRVTNKSVLMLLEYAKSPKIPRKPKSFREISQITNINLVKFCWFW